MDGEPTTMSFQKIVIIIAIVLLIITLSAIGYLMYSAAQNKPYPPTSTTCPDLWLPDISGNCTMSLNPFANVGSYIIRDISCGLTGANICSSYIPGWTDGSKCGEGWVQGNPTNKLDKKSCYLLASSVENTGLYTGVSAPSMLTHTMSNSLGTNVDWAKTYGITWDGFN